MKDSIEIFGFLISISKSCDSSYYPKDDYLELKNFQDQDLQKKLVELEVNSYSISNEEIHIPLKDLNFLFFWNDESFRKKIISYPLGKDIGIFNPEAEDRFWSNYHQKEYKNLENSDSNFFNNAFAYLEFINFLKVKSEYNNEEFQFIDYYDKTNKHFIISSTNSAEKVYLKDPNEVPEMEDSQNIKPKLEELYNSFTPENKHLPKFIKNELVKQLTPIDKNERFLFLLNNLKLILDKSNVNFNIFLYELSLEKILSEYKEYKQKYFSQQNEIVSKISNQVFALPLSVAGSAFAISRVDSQFAILIIILSLIFFSYYLTNLLITFWADLVKIKKDVLTDYNDLKIQDFFVKHKLELFKFTETKNYIYSRAINIQKRVRNFYYILCSSALLLIIYSSLKIYTFSIEASLIAIFFFMAIIAFIGNNYFNDQETELSHDDQIN